MEMVIVGYKENWNAIWMSEEELRRHYEEHKEELLKVRFKPEFGGAKGRKLALFSGFLTMMTEQVNLRSGWAGDFIMGWE